VDTLFKALNDPTRRAILELLKKKDMTAGEIADQFNIQAQYFASPGPAEAGLISGGSKRRSVYLLFHQYHRYG